MEEVVGDLICSSDWSYATIPMENIKLDIFNIQFTIANPVSANSTPVSITGATSKYIDPVNPIDEFGSPVYIDQTTEATGGTVTITKSTTSADLNQDGKVNSVDAAIMMGQWTI
jgi:hypothetical protein